MDFVDGCLFASIVEFALDHYVVLTISALAVVLSKKITFKATSNSTKKVD